jgi:hypothetical protein
MSLAPEAVTVIPRLEGRLLLSQPFQDLSSLCQIELLRRLYDETVDDGPQQLSYPILRSLQQMASSSSLPLPLSTVPSSLSISDQWEAIVLREYFLFRRRDCSASESESCELEIGSDNTINISFPTDRFSVSAQPFLESDPALSPPPPPPPDDRRNQILARKTLTALHNLPKDSRLVLRSDDGNVICETNLPLGQSALAISSIQVGRLEAFEWLTSAESSVCLSIFGTRFLSSLSMMERFVCASLVSADLISSSRLWPYLPLSRRTTAEPKPPPPRQSLSR